MTKKDYKMIARIIRRFNSSYYVPRKKVEAFIEALIIEMEIDNPRFDKEVFLRECKKG